MAIAMRLCATVLFLAAAHVPAQAGGTISFRGAVVEPTVAQNDDDAIAQASTDASRHVGMQRLDVSATHGVELLAYFVAREDSRRVDPDRVRLVTVTYD